MSRAPVRFLLGRVATTADLMLPTLAQHQPVQLVAAAMTHWVWVRHEQRAMPGPWQQASTRRHHCCLRAAQTCSSSTCCCLRAAQSALRTCCRLQRSHQKSRTNSSSDPTHPRSARSARATGAGSCTVCRQRVLVERPRRCNSAWPSRQRAAVGLSAISDLQVTAVKVCVAERARHARSHSTIAIRTARAQDRPTPNARAASNKRSLRTFE